MESKQIKIRINLDQREFEVQGDVQYIDDTFGQYIKECLDIIRNSATIKNTDEPGLKSENSHAKEVNKQSKDIPESFGEYLNKFPKSINNVDKILIAGYYIQMSSESKSFTVSEASNVLVEQGIKLSNANAFNKGNLDTKKIFILSGKNFRVSESGVEYIKNIS